MNKHQRLQAGFGLLEILIASAVLAVVLVGLIGLFSMTIKSDAQARNRLVASELAQEGLDFIRQERQTLGWLVLKQALENNNPRVNSLYCLSDLTQFSSSLDDNVYDIFTAGADCSYSLEQTGANATFKRVGKVVSLNDDQMELQVRVSWQADRSVSTPSETEVVMTLVLHRY